MNTVVKLDCNVNSDQVSHASDTVKYTCLEVVVKPEHDVLMPSCILCRYIQFSGIAIAVAHEITHGFDDEGIAAYRSVVVLCWCCMPVDILRLQRSVFLTRG